MAVRVEGRLTDPLQFENIIIKSNSQNTARELRAPGSGSGIVLLKDVGRAELGAESYDTNLR